MITPYDSSKDRLSVYSGENKVQASIDNIATTYPCWLVETTFDIMDDITLEVVSSIYGDDVRLYTDTEVDAAMKYVTGLTITNTTTGKYMAFPDIKFRNGDAIRVITERGNLSAVVIESDWMEIGQSLVYEIMRNGSFFKIAPGTNVLGITADTNSSFVSGDISIKVVYGGI